MKRPFQCPVCGSAEGRFVFSVVRRLPNREDAGRPHRWQRAGVGQSPREETAECCEAVRVSGALWGFDRRGLVSKRRAGEPVSGIGGVGRSQVRWAAIDRRLRIESAVPSGVSGGRHKPSARGWGNTRSRQTIGIWSMDATTGRLAVRAVDPEWMHHAPGSRPRSSAFRSTDTGRSAGRT